VGTIVYSRLETTLLTEVRIQAMVSVTALVRGAVYPESCHADMRCFHRVPGTKQARKVEEDRWMSGTIDSAKAGDVGL
jgi:hypothetical protein